MVHNDVITIGHLPCQHPGLMRENLKSRRKKRSANKNLRFHLVTTKHSKKESKPEGCSKGEKNDDDILFRAGPIMIKEIMQD
jgi:hypothetical protein